MLFSGCQVPFRRTEAAPLLPSTAQPNYWPLPVSEGIGGGLESGGIGTPEGRGMQQERIENEDCFNDDAGDIDSTCTGVSIQPLQALTHQVCVQLWPSLFRTS